MAEQRCGTCQYWSEYGPDYLRECLYKPPVMPSWVTGLDGDNWMWNHNGKDCPTWQPKTT